MITGPEFLAGLWRRSCGLDETPACVSVVGTTVLAGGRTLDAIQATQATPGFDALCTNRMLMGVFRYGDLAEQKAAGGNRRNNVGSAIRRLQAYQQTGNTEHLIDAANLCRVEFEVGHHPRKHWASTDDGRHVEQVRNG